MIQECVFRVKWRSTASSPDGVLRCPRRTCRAHSAKPNRLQRASITIGRLLNAYLRSLPDDDPAQEAALPPICDCTPNELRESMTRLLNDHTAPPGLARWALRLLADLTPLLNWKIVLAHARFPEPTLGNQRVMSADRGFGTV